MYECRSPKNKQEFEQYYQLRWQVLREPWGQARGSEKDDLESLSIHRALFDNQGNIVAVARLHCSGQYQANIRYMAVHESYRNQGLGALLIAELEQQACLLGMNSVLLNAREQAMPFYTRLAYQNLGFSHLLYQEVKHFTMEKLLTGHNDHQQDAAMALQQTWHQTIPMSKAMNINICYYDQQRLVVSCDSTFNKNLHNTMFAGSIYTLATLTGWGWVYLLLQQHELVGDIVLADAKIRYLAPIQDAAHAETSIDLIGLDHKASLKKLSTKQKAKFTVEVLVKSGDLVTASFRGLYFVLPK